MHWNAMMIEFATRSEAFRFEIDPMTVETFDVLVEGPGVELITGNTDPELLSDPDAIKPDPLKFLADCVAAGFFVPADAAGPTPVLTVLQTQLDITAQRQTWSVQATNLHPGVFRILANILVALQVYRVAITSETPAAANDPTALPYPPLPQGVPFQIDYKRPDILGENRSIMITLNQPPSDDTLSGVYKVLETWWRIPLMGAYPDDDQSPLESGLMPEVAYLHTPTEIYQGIEIAFACDEAAFVPCVTALHLNPAIGSDVAKVTIR